jgi:EAL domain-containing protein (putative c-di-GMP-specific phosphodiesterase class I)
MAEEELLRRIEALHKKIEGLGERALKDDQRKKASYAARFMQHLAHAVNAEAPVFDIEPWHPLDGTPFPSPGEMLLRVRDEAGDVLAPYPAVMTFYHNGFTSELDTILVMAALIQFRRGNEKQVSINISCRSLDNADFVKTILAHLEMMKLKPDEKILFEIHESNAAIKINPKTLAMFKKFRVGFAMDDVGLSMNDVFRLSSFENVADYIKLDRASLGAHPEDPRALSHILSLAKSLLPDAVMVAEGIKSADHAKEILKIHPNIRYVQGMHLPDRETFAEQWKQAKSTKN